MICPQVGTSLRLARPRPSRRTGKTCPTAYSIVSAMTEQDGVLRRGRGPWLWRCVIAVCSLLTASPLLAHDFWIEPDRFRPQAGETVTVRLRVGVDFEGDPVPRADRQIERFVMVTNAGETPVVG